MEKKAAEDSFNLKIVNDIDNIKGMVTHLELELLELERGDLNVIKPAPYPLQKYEYFITKFSEEIFSFNFHKDAGRYEKELLTSLKRSTSAKYVFVARYINGEWKINGADSADEKEIKGKYIQSEKLNYLLNLKPQQGMYYFESATDSKLSLLFPFGKDNSEILIFHELNNDVIYDKAFELILRTILTDTNNFKNPQPAEKLELSIYNNLRKNFGLVSDAIYNRQYYLFNMNLEKMSIEYEPIIFISPDAPSIFGWEALARNPKTSRAPTDLFDTADLWGVRFQLQLDMYFLKKAVELYGMALVHKSRSRRNWIDGSEKLCHFVTLGHTQMRHFVESSTAN